MWRPPLRSVVPPFAEADFHLLDDEPPIDLGFNVIDAGTGGEIDLYRVAWHLPDGSVERTWLREAGSPVALRNVDGRLDVSWVLAAAGHQPAFGTLSDFTEVMTRPALHPESNEYRIATVKLNPGWGARILVTGPEDEPIPGARVFIEGELSGTTAADGSVTLLRDSQPSEVTVQYLDWVVASGDLTAYDQDFRDVWGEIEVPMRPRD